MDVCLQLPSPRSCIHPILLSVRIVSLAVRERHVHSLPWSGVSARSFRSVVHCSSSLLEIPSVRQAMNAVVAVGWLI